jgi:hypothetical protein
MMRFSIKLHAPSGGQKEAVLFEKRTKNVLIAKPRVIAETQESFLLLFYKKEALSFLRLSRRERVPRTSQPRASPRSAAAPRRAAPARR